MAIQIFTRIQDSFSALHWFTNPDGQKAVGQVVKDVAFSTTPAWFDRLSIGLAYVLRMLHATVSLFGKRVDIVYSGSDFFPDVLPAFLYCRFRRNTRWVQCVFHIDPDWRTRPGNMAVNFAASLLQRFSLWLSRHADGVVNINSEVRESLIIRGFDAKRIAIITPGIDLDYIASISPGDDQDAYDAVFLGRINPSKGIFDLPPIWKKVTERLSHARLAIIGGGSEPIIVKLAAELEANGLHDTVDLLGYVETERIYALMKRARLFVFPSHEEGFGIAILEAMACGTPVVAWDLPVYKELFKGAIIAIPLGNQQAFAEVIVALLRNTKIETKSDMLLQAHQCAQRYSWSSVSLDMRLWLLGSSHSTLRVVLRS
jgi:glycosyltransferase involved in cell wall biosynthesis